MKVEKLKVEYVYSTKFDRDLAKHLNESEIWKNCYHEDDVPQDFIGYQYKIAFQGLTPVQVQGIKKFNY